MKLKFPHLCFFWNNPGQSPVLHPSSVKGDEMVEEIIQATHQTIESLIKENATPDAVAIVT
ncbi:hypothetical protein [Oceanobacillus sp. FSL H7-0719]|uniref:hypothetical protein n=1 Tax=Oceanobacillus sp. FSL H7-0719 TaxID=2954507 RepID=UPI00325121BF